MGRRTHGLVLWAAMSIGCEPIAEVSLDSLIGSDASEPPADARAGAIDAGGFADSGAPADARVRIDAGGGGFTFDAGWGDAQPSRRDGGGGPPIDGSAGSCAELAGCCPSLPAQAQATCANAASGGDEGRCASFLAQARMRGGCGGGPAPDGGPRIDSGLAIDAGRRGDGGRRRDTGMGLDAAAPPDSGRPARDGGRPRLDAGPLGPSCQTLVECCDQVPAQRRNQCLRGATLGDEAVCVVAIDRLQTAGLCLPADSGA